MASWKHVAAGRKAGVSSWGAGGHTGVQHASSELPSPRRDGNRPCLLPSKRAEVSPVLQSSTQEEAPKINGFSVLIALPNDLFVPLQTAIIKSIWEEEKVEPSLRQNALEEI